MICLKGLQHSALGNVAGGVTLLYACPMNFGFGGAATLVWEPHALHQALLSREGAKRLSLTGGLLFSSSFLLLGCAPQ